MAEEIKKNSDTPAPEKSTEKKQKKSGKPGKRSEIFSVLCGRTFVRPFLLTV